MQSAERETRIGGALHIAGRTLTTAIDAVAKLLTGNEEYFRGLGSSATDAQREHWKRWDAIERGENPWPK
jgi:hypothetical protein